MDLTTGFKQAHIKADLFTVEKLYGLVCIPGSDTITVTQLCEFYASCDLGMSEFSSSEASGGYDATPADPRSSTGSRPPPLLETQSPDISKHEEDNLLKVSKDDVKDLLQHISLRMQLHRLPKSKLLVSLFGKNFDKEREYSLAELSDMFKVKPFGFEGIDQCTALARYLLEGPDANMFTTELQISKLAASAKEIGGKLFMELEEWEVFKPEDEKLFDKEIANIVSRNKLSFKECCKSYDTEGTGFINVEDFMETLETLELEFDEHCLRYMLLLFYSHSFDLNRVPYKQFTKAYSTLEISQHETSED
jgi:hypothetical protein